MSAIIAGKSCKKCKKEYWLSLGHPKWYDDVVKRSMPKSDDFLAFERMARSGMCPNCFVKENAALLPGKGIWKMMKELHDRELMLVGFMMPSED